MNIQMKTIDTAPPPPTQKTWIKLLARLKCICYADALTLRVSKGYSHLVLNKYF